MEFPYGGRTRSGPAICYFDVFRANLINSRGQVCGSSRAKFHTCRLRRSGRSRGNVVITRAVGNRQVAAAAVAAENDVMKRTEIFAERLKHEIPPSITPIRFLLQPSS